MKSSSLLRLNFIVVALCTTTLFLASSVGVIPDQRRAECEARERLSESVAAQLT